jgi:predicted acylesterase/phospholipase RssA
MKMKLSPQQQDIFDSLMSEKDEIESPCQPLNYRVLRRIATNSDNHLAISFGGGSVPGIAGNCALAALLEELEIRPHIKEIWGSSAGAVVGGGWSSGTSGEAIRDMVGALHGKGSIDFSKWDILVKGVLRFLFFKKLPDGLVRGRILRKAIVDNLSRQTFEECEIPCRIVACTDDGQARKVIFRKGPLADAIMASMCLPGVFYPVECWNGNPYGYFDGGVVEKTPLLSIIEEHARINRTSQLVVLGTHFSSPECSERPEGFLARSLSTINQLEDTVWEYQVTQGRESANCKFIMLDPHMKMAGMFNFALVYFHYLWARRMFKEQLSNAGLAKRFGAV